MKSSIRLLISLLLLQPLLCNGEYIDAKLQYVGASPVSNTVIAAPDVVVIPGTSCKSKEIKWSADEKTAGVILSVLLSAYHTDKAVRIAYQPEEACIGGAQKGTYVRFIE